MTARPNRTYHLTPTIRARMAAYLDDHGGSLADLHETDRLRDQLRRVFVKGTGAERAELLDLGWRPDILAAEWDSKFSRLLEFRAERGTAHVPARYKTSDGIKLGNWYHWQPIRAQRGTMAADQCERLVAVGVDLANGGAASEAA